MRIIWRTVRRITNEILEVKGLNKYRRGSTETWREGGRGLEAYDELPHIQEE